jgi:hypothetical protein
LHPRVVVGVSALDWDTDELKTLFSSPVYVDGERARGGAGEATYWLAVLALHHGFRAMTFRARGRARPPKRHETCSAWSQRMHFGPRVSHDRGASGHRIFVAD